MIRFLILLFIFSNSAQATEILQIGNSHTVGHFGESLYKTLYEQTGKSIYAVGLGGASATTYSSENVKDRTIAYGFVERKSDGTTQKIGAKPATVRKLSDYLAEHKPSILIVELGDNFANYKRTINNPSEKSSDQLVREQVQKIIKQLPTSNSPKCFWVGPTWTSQDRTNQYGKTNARAKRVAELIQEELRGKCEFVDSLQVIKKEEIVTSSDGLHFDKINGSKWGTAVAKEILRRFPSQSNPKPQRPQRDSGVN